MSKEPSVVLQIPPDEIKENPENPRHLFYEEHLDILRESINRNGVLVPLVVFKRDGERKYTLLDGQRRWMCSKRLKLKTVPANIIPTPDKRQNILLMFNMHKVREDWELVPTALKLEVLIRLLPKGTGTKEIATLTGMTTSRVTHCLRVLRFDKKYLDLTLVKDPARRIRGEFLAQLEEALEKLSDEDYKQIGYTKNQITDIMIEKYQDKEFVNLIKEFRTLRKVFTSAKKGADKKFVNKQVSTYLKSKTVKDDKGNVKSRPMTVDDLYEVTSYNVYAEDEIIAKAEKMNTILHKFDINKVNDKKRVQKSLEKLRDTIDEILSV